MVVVAVVVVDEIKRGKATKLELHHPHITSTSESGGIGLFFQLSLDNGHCQCQQENSESNFRTLFKLTSQRSDFAQQENSESSFRTLFKLTSRRSDFASSQGP